MKSTLATILGITAVGLLKNRTGSSVRLKKELSAQVTLNCQLRIPIKNKLNVYSDQDMEEVDDIKDSIFTIDCSETGIEVDDIRLEYEDTNVIYVNLSIKLGQLLQSTQVIEISKILEKKVNQFIRNVRERVETKGPRKKIKIESAKIEERRSYVKKKDTIYGLYTPDNWFESYTFLKSKKPMVEFDIELSNPSELVINADTGEVYKAPALPTSNLRKR